MKKVAKKVVKQAVKSVRVADGKKRLNNTVTSATRVWLAKRAAELGIGVGALIDTLVKEQKGLKK